MLMLIMRDIWLYIFRTHKTFSVFWFFRGNRIESNRLNLCGFQEKFGNKASFDDLSSREIIRQSKQISCIQNIESIVCIDFRWMKLIYIFKLWHLRCVIYLCTLKLKIISCVSSHLGLSFAMYFRKRAVRKLSLIVEAMFIFVSSTEIS